MALRRPRDIERAAHLEVLSLVVECVELCRVEIDLGRPVADECVVLPAVPQSLDDLDEFVGAVVALVMRVMRVAAEIPGFVDRRRGHHVPPGAAVADMIEGGEFAGDVVGLVVARRRRRNDPDILGDRGQRGQQGQRIEIGHVLRPAAERLELSIADCHRVGNKHEVELAALGRLGDRGVMLEIGAGIDLCVRMQPGRHMIAGRVKERAQMHLLVAALLVHRLPLPGKTPSVPSRSKPSRTKPCGGANAPTLRLRGLGPHTAASLLAPEFIVPRTDIYGPRLAILKLELMALRCMEDELPTTLNTDLVATAHIRNCEGFSDACMTTYPRAPTAGVRKAPRHEIAGGGSSRMQRALWRFSRSGDVAGGGSGRAEGAFQPAVVGERGGSRA